MKPNTRPAPKFSGNEEAIRKLVGGLRPTDFYIWLRNQHFWDIRHFHIARTALSTYVESRCRLQDGVRFDKDMNITVGLPGGKSDSFVPPIWMKRYAESFPKADWTA